MSGCTARPGSNPERDPPPTATATVEAATPPSGTAGTDAPIRVRRRSAASLPVPRTEVTGTAWRGMVVVAGGLTADGAASPLVHAYDARRDQWERLPDLPVALHHTAVGVLAGDLYAVGGYSGRRPWVPERRVWVLSPGAQSWREGPPLTVARGALAVASTDDTLVAVGGVGPFGTHQSAEVLRASPGRWQALPSLATAREHLAATTGPSGVLAIGGRDGGLATNRNSVEVLTGGGWRPAPALRYARGGIAAATVAGLPCVIGGEEPAGTIAPVECLAGGGWTVVADIAVPRHGLAGVALGRALHVIGGGPRPGLTVSEAHEVLEFAGPSPGSGDQRTRPTPSAPATG
jgi:Kelch motif/Galactose oxidase, central domain